MKCRAQIIKNRLGPPLRHADYDMYFESGIDNLGGWLTVLKDHKLVKSAGAWYTLVDGEGKEHKFQSKDWDELMEDEELKSYVFDLICNKVILQYKTEDMGIDDIEYTDEIVGD